MMPRRELSVCPTAPLRARFWSSMVVPLAFPVATGRFSGAFEKFALVSVFGERL